MAYERPYHPPARATARDKMCAAQRLRPPISAKSRAKITAPELSETLSAEPPAMLAAVNHAKPQSPELVAKRFASRRAARIANEQQLAALCYRRASRWADAICEGLDPDIARFVCDQVAAWQLLASSYAVPQDTPY